MLEQLVEAAKCERGVIEADKDPEIVRKPEADPVSGAIGTKR